LSSTPYFVMAGGLLLGGALKLTPALIKVFDDKEHAHEGVRLTKSKLEQVGKAIEDYHEDGYSQIQLQPLLECTTRLALEFADAEEGCIVHEQNVGDFSAWRRSSVSSHKKALKWMVGGFTVLMDELENKVNQEMIALGTLRAKVQSPGDYTSPQPKATRSSTLLTGQSDRLPTYCVGDVVDYWSRSSKPEQWITTVVRHVYPDSVVIDLDCKMCADKQNVRKHVQTGSGAAASAQRPPQNTYPGPTPASAAKTQAGVQAEAGTQPVYEIGSHVFIVGLKSAPLWNSQVAQVKGHDGSTGRYDVCVAGKQTLSVKEVNLCFAKTYSHGQWVAGEIERSTSVRLLWL